MKITKNFIQIYLVDTIALAGLLAFSQVAFAGAGKVRVTTSGSCLNMRSQAQGRVLTCIPSGTVLAVTGARNGNWIQVSYGSRTGWIYAKYSRSTASSVATSLPTSPTTPQRSRTQSPAPNNTPIAYGSCGQITFNCDQHIASVGRVTSPLDCGLATPQNHTGQIISAGHASGSIWKCLAGKPMINIGLGNVIVHTPCGREPVGQNQTFAHSGCLNVSTNVLNALSRCRGSSYTIQYASKGNWNGGKYLKRNTKQYLSQSNTGR